MKAHSSFPAIQSHWNIPFKMFAFLAMSGVAHAQNEASVQDDKAWLQSKGALLFEDTFDRKVAGNGLKDIGNGWESATADRAPQIRQADIDEASSRSTAMVRLLGMASTSITMPGSPMVGQHCAFGFPA